MKNILTKEEINHINDVCKEYNIVNYYINSDGSINVDGNVNLYKKGLDKLPLKFSKVSGNFYCYNNQLTSLEGCPSSISGHFHCSANNLTSLEFSPTSVGGNFYCDYNKLTSLKECTESLGGYFYCSDNQLPQHFINLYDNLSPDEFKIFIKYQHDLRIWDNNDYKEEAAQDLYEEIKDGML